MSNKSYAVLLVLAGIVCGILVVSLSSSPASAKLPTEGRITVKPGLGKAPQRVVPPLVARPNIHVYPVGVGKNPNQSTRAYAYIVIDGKIWHCEGTDARRVNLQ